MSLLKDILTEAELLMVPQVEKLANAMADEIEKTAKELAKKEKESPEETRIRIRNELAGLNQGDTLVEAIYDDACKDLRSVYARVLKDRMRRYK